ncbi:hypothetical protein [Flammeovirga sp. SJP92]|uniref:hypothetical protein n=1 Tax=Flammeovirga sp. SJP92 TaxID=1775430 RepID=UPI0007895740|nr:hypothetical protein [Flammeovirga sp. SJP92]KXX71239.1 hypothetical protein AVL50_09285 [Flammeovirga sp. SJP92]
MKKLILTATVCLCSLAVFGQTNYSGILSHKSSYFTIFPYNSQYDDNSYVKLFYDGNNNLINFWNSDSDRPFTSLAVNKVITFGDIELGHYRHVTGSDTDTYGNKLVLRGGHSNSDPTWIARYNREADKTSFRVNIGDDGVSNHDLFDVGFTYWKDSEWKSRFTVDMSGNAYIYQSLNIGNETNQYGYSLAVTGKVGIGTNAPKSQLFVKQSGETNTSGLSIQDLATRTINIYGEGPSGRQVISTTGTNNPLAFILNGTEAMRMDYRGHVGIGTTNLSDFKLSVKGKIRAEEVKVYTGWADYVFEEDYHLKSLSEVEAHIKEYKHLPDVPSAKEVEENGVNVGETEAMLLRKIEELTLYTIEQQKLIEEQNEKISKLEKLQSEIETIKELIKNK